MTEDRKRSILRRQPPSGPGNDPYDNPDNDPEGGEETEYIPRESLLEKRVYLPLPMILVGFLTIIIMSVSLTYVAVMWPTAELEFPENPELARFEAAANPGNLPKKIYRPETSLALDAPLENIFLPRADTSRRYARLEQSAADGTLARDFSPREARPAGMPVADPKPATRQKKIFGATTTAQSLDTLEQGPLASATGVQAPVAQPVLETRQADAAAYQQYATPLEAKNWPEAREVSRPQVNNSANPLLESATGGGLVTRSARLDPAIGVIGPVAEITLKASLPADGGGQPAAVIETKAFDGRRASSPGELVADVRPTEWSLDFQPNLNDNTGVSPKESSFENAVGLEEPVARLDLPQRQAAYPDGLRDSAGLETRDISLAAALGLDKPLALTDLPVRRAAGEFSALEVPGQKQLQRRYARAVIPPERMDAIPAPTPALRETLPLSGEDAPPWRRYAAAVPEGIEGKGKIVIIIDDMGNSPAMARNFGDLAGPLNFAFLPYAPNLGNQTGALRAGGHELLVHLPMEPSGDETPGPHALLTSQSDEEILRAIEWNLSRFEGFVGVNNHMGSRFTKDSKRMQLVMEELQRRGLLFLDSRTAPHSEGARWAKSLGMPWAGRDVFLDNEIDEAAILAQLKKVERIATRRGLAIAIGHPHGATLRALRQWIPTLEANGLVLVPLSSVVEQDGLAKLASATPE